MPVTLGALYLSAEHTGSRRVVTREWDGHLWRETAGWRFFRQILRVGLYLRERAAVGRGDCVVTLSRLRTERFVAEWAAVVQGVVVAPLGPRPSDDLLASALENLAPRIVFVGGADERRRLVKLAGARPRFDIIVFDELAAAEDKTYAWSTVCELGGTFDTAERALMLRAEIRAITPQVAALAYPKSARDRGTSTTWQRATHAQVVEQMLHLRHSRPAEPGGVAYVVEDPHAMGFRLPLWALVADGLTSIAIGTPGREAAEINELQPQIAVLPPEAARAAVENESLVPHPSSVAWIDRVPGLRRLRERAVAAARHDRLPIEIFTLNGTRMR
jgi:hypothetical protein